MSLDGHRRVLLFQNFHSQQSTLNWHTDLNKAVNISINEKKPIMLFFTGSDWCGWCMRLKKEVFNKILNSNLKSLHNHNLFIFGIKPTIPSSDYGYLLCKKKYPQILFDRWTY